MIKGNKRLHEESFEKHRERIKTESRAIKTYLKGYYMWLSTSIRNHRGIVQHEGKGTYSRCEHGEIGRKLIVT